MCDGSQPNTASGGACTGVCSGIPFQTWSVCTVGSPLSSGLRVSAFAPCCTAASWRCANRGGDADRAAWPRGAAAAVRRELGGATAPPAHLLCASALQRRRPSPGALLARDGSAQLQQRQPAVRPKRRRRVPALRPRPARQRPARHRPLQRSGHARVLARGRRGGGRLEARGRAALGRRGAEGRRAALRPLGADRAHLAQPARAADRQRRVARRGAHLVRVRVRVRVS